MSQKTLFVITVTDREGKETERLVNAHKHGVALGHVATVRKAKPFDVARIVSAGAEVEEADYAA